MLSTSSRVCWRSFTQRLSLLIGRGVLRSILVASTKTNHQRAVGELLRTPSTRSSENSPPTTLVNKGKRKDRSLEIPRSARPPTRPPLCADLRRPWPRCTGPRSKHTPRGGSAAAGRTARSFCQLPCRSHHLQLVTSLMALDSYLGS